MATANTTERNENSTSDGPRKQRPIWSKGFPTTVAVFEFPNRAGDGPPTFSAKLTDAYRRDENSDWEYSDYLSGGKLLRAAKLLEAADAFVQSRLEAYYRSRKADRDAVETGDSF